MFRNYVSCAISSQKGCMMLMFMKCSANVKAKHQGCYKYVDWEEIKEKDDPEFNKVIKACELFGLTDIMSFRYNWNEEVLA